MIKQFWNCIVGEPLPPRLSIRVQNSIAERQIDAEKLIGWVQLALVLFWSLLFAIAPKTDAVTLSTPTPWVLVFYFVFTVIRVFLVNRGFAPGWFLMTSVIVDIAMLMALIWSFHLQYDQPPSFYLKAPTLLYVFIFIALRALRFEPRYVLAAGLAAAVGWLALFGYALRGPNTILDPMTRDYVLYMTSNRVLVGAEIDKIISILLVTLILLVAIVRAQRFLTRAIVEETTATELSRFVAPEVADRIANAERAIEPGDGEVKIATVLFTDIEGFSTVSEQISALELNKTLNEYFQAMAEIIEAEGGVIYQFEGDALLVTFNTVRNDPEHAKNALKVAMGIRAMTLERTFGDGYLLKTRCGVNTGEILVGAVGTCDRLIYTVHGDDVNIAARLEQLNKEFGTYILASESTIGEAGCVDMCERMGEITVRGREKPTVIYGLKIQE